MLWFEEKGTDIVRVREIMPVDSPDPVVAEAAMSDGRILVSWDRDFNHQRFRQPRFEDLRRIGLSCSEPDGIARLEEIEWILLYVLTAADGPPLETRIARDKIMFRDKR